MALPLLMAGAGLLSSALQASGGRREAREAERALDNYQRQELYNPHKNRAISTVGSDIMKEQTSQFSANLLDTLKGGGARTLLSGIPKIQSQINRDGQNTRKYIDEKIDGRNRDIANFDGKIQDMEERREEADISGLGQQINVGRQNMFSGFNGMFNSVLSGIGGFDGFGGMEGSGTDWSSKFNKYGKGDYSL